MVLVYEEEELGVMTEAEAKRRDRRKVFQVTEHFYQIWRILIYPKNVLSYTRYVKLKSMFGPQKNSLEK